MKMRRARLDSSDRPGRGRPSTRRVKLDQVFDPSILVPPPGQTNNQAHHVKRRDYLTDTPKEMSKIEERFVHNYCAHYDPARAAIEAGYRPSRGYAIAIDLLKEPRIQHAVRVIEHERVARITYDGDMAARMNWLRAYHPRLPTVFNSYIPCCRHCHGTNFEYQRTHAEFEADWDEYCKDPKKKAKGPFDQKGGSNFDETLTPNPSCPNCNGKGLPQQQRIILKDLNHLSPEAHALISGIKMKNGKVEEILFHDVGSALDHLKPLNLRWHELQNSTKPINIDDLTLEQMEQMIEEGRQLGFLSDDE